MDVNLYLSINDTHPTHPSFPPPIVPIEKFSNKG